MGSDYETRIRNVTAVLGPTNTGKTHLAIERMLGHESGMIGLPLRLLAREVYDRIVQRVGVGAVALITGEEKIKPDSARYWVCTVEAMPREVTVDFLAVDEIQLAADFERGHVFTDRLLHARGRQETLLLGASTMRDAISDLVPGANFISRPRLSKLTYAGQKKLTRLPKRTAIVAFSAAEVYAVADLIRKQQGGAAVVTGALSPRTRNAQVALYQSGDVDYLVATDAIGMGLNLDLDHVALAATRKFDGQNHRNLTPDEIAQIAGRAGRHMNDGTFGVTGAAEPLDAELVERLEQHLFDPVRTLQWRNRAVDFSTLYALRESLRDIPRVQRLARARMADDVAALETLAGDRDIASLADNPAAVALLWEVCQVPDYRKISASSHSELVGQVFKFLRSDDNLIPEDWFAKQVAFSDRTDGDIDTLSNRLAHIRTWTFVANRPNWLKDPGHWRDRTREIEDKLSDALHESLTSKFVDRRTSALMRGMRDKDELAADIGEDGAVKVEDHYVGRLQGFRFVADAPSADGINQKAARIAAYLVVSRELSMRTRRVAAAKPEAFKITRLGRIQWRGDDIAEVAATDDPLKLTVTLLVDDAISAPDREKLQTRLDLAVSELIGERLKPLVELSKAEDVSGLARGIAFQMTENLGILKRETVAEQIKTLDQTSRAQLRKYGVRFGAFNIFIPALLKPAPADLALSLWCIKHAKAHGLDPAALPEPPRAGLTSVLADPAIPEAFYRASGYHVCGPRAVRLDILERLADIIRPLLAWRQPKEAGAEPQTPPRGSTGSGGFLVLPEMMSILGCSPDELSLVLQSLGFESEKRLVKPKPVAAKTPVVVAAASPVAADGAAEAVVDASQAEAAEAAPSPDAPVAAEAVVEPPSVSAPAEADAGAMPVAAGSEAVAASASGTDVAAAVEAAAAPEEPKYEDVWRPKRAHRPRREGQGQGRGAGAGGGQGAGQGQRWRDRRGPARPPAGDGAAPVPGTAAATDAGGAATEGAGARPGRDRGPRRDFGGDRGGNARGGADGRGGYRGGQRPGSGEGRGPGAGPGSGAATAKDGEPGVAAGGRPDHRGRPDQEKRGEYRGDRPRRDGGPRDGGGRDGGGRDRPGGGERRDTRGPRVVSAAPAKPSGGASDSPFAALGALRAQLANKGKDDKSA
jgi:ATP-dependent RNA helicase SUPV3L1/SUV3